MHSANKKQDPFKGKANELLDELIARKLQPIVKTDQSTIATNEVIALQHLNKIKKESAKIIEAALDELGELKALNDKGKRACGLLLAVYDSSKKVEQFRVKFPKISAEINDLFKHYKEINLLLKNEKAKPDPIELGEISNPLGIIKKHHRTKLTAKTYFGMVQKAEPNTFKNMDHVYDFDSRTYSTYQITELADAIRRERLEEAQELLKSGADPNAPSRVTVGSASMFDSRTGGNTSVPINHSAYWVSVTDGYTVRGNDGGFLGFNYSVCVQKDLSPELSALLINYGGIPNNNSAHFYTRGDLALYYGLEYKTTSLELLQLFTNSTLPYSAKTIIAEYLSDTKIQTQCDLAQAKAAVLTCLEQESKSFMGFSSSEAEKARALLAPCAEANSNRKIQDLLKANGFFAILNKCQDTLYKNNEVFLEDQLVEDGEKSVF